MPNMDARAYDTEGSATSHEVDFVRGLGMHSVAVGPHQHRRAVPEDRLELLQNYLLGMERRDEWGAIDRDRVRAEVLLQIEDETKHRAAFIPRNGHGIFGSRQYAKRTGHRGGAE